MSQHVKSWMTIMAMLVTLRVAGMAADTKSIQERELDERSVCAVPVSFSRVTTISFPGPISAIDAALVTTDGKTTGLFQLAHKPGSYFFSVRSLVKGATTNVNVRWNNRTYVLELQDSTTPLLSLVLKHPTTAYGAALSRRSVTPGSLVGLLDKAKAYPVLKASHPESVENVDYVAYGEKLPVMDYNDFEIRLEEVFRFDPQDTLVFRVVLRNKTDREIPYQRQGFSVRIGERVYFQSISDATGVMPPTSDTPAYFAITGTPSGGRNDISTKNDFNVVLTQSEGAEATPRTSVEDKGGFAK